MSEWPPTHQIRRSRKARNISLSLTQKKGLEIVLPIRASVKEGIAFLNSKRHWVEKHLPTLNQSILDDTVFPSELSLNSLNQIWQIRYHHIHASKKVRLRHFNNRLIFTGPMLKFNDCKPAFNQWLRQLAKDYLPQHLLQLSQETELSFNRVSVRSQRSLWGSCNRNNDISLNDRLLFLPTELMRYVLIHELCHTVYFGHGQRFWQLVSKFDPNFKQNERSLRDVSNYIPSYFYP